MSKEVFNEGPTTSQHVEADDEDFFKKTTFKLKRTRSMGLLDDFISQAHGLDDGGEEATFVSSATLQRLNLGASGGANEANSPYTADELDHVPSFYREVIPSHKKSLHGAAETANGSALVPKHEQKRQELRSKQEERIRQHHLDQITSHVLHDDTDVEDRPKQHVDYLSHKWRAADEVLKCWRYVVMKKHDFADAARLENASWRTWAQTRNHLKTISPEELNWSKDADVTWLYGPAFWDETSRSRLHSASGSRVDVHAAAGGDDVHVSRGVVGASSAGAGRAQHGGAGNFSAAVANNNGTPRAQGESASAAARAPTPASPHPADQHPEHLKSILKRRSNVENLIGDGSYSRLQSLLEEREHKFKGSPVLEPGSAQLAANLPSTPSPLALDGAPNAGGSGARLRRSAGARLLAGPQKSSLKKHKPNKNLLASLAKKAAEAHPLQLEKQSFNEYYDGDDSSSSSSSGYSSSSSAMEDDRPVGASANYDDESDGFVFKAASSNLEPDKAGQKFVSIAPLPATTLKTDSDDENLEKRSLYTVSHNTRTNRGYEYYYDYNTVYSNSSNPIYPVVSGSNDDVQMVDVPPDVLGLGEADAQVPAPVVPQVQPQQAQQAQFVQPAQPSGATAPAHRRDSASSQASRGTFVFGSDSDYNSDSDSESDSDASYSSRSSSASLSGSASGSSLNLNTNLASQSHNQLQSQFQAQPHFHSPIGPSHMSRKSASSSSQHSNGSFVFNSDSEDDSEDASIDAVSSPLQTAPSFVPSLPSFSGTRTLAATSNATAVSSTARYGKKRTVTRLSPLWRPITRSPGAANSFSTSRAFVSCIVACAFFFI
ncbi:hypothetical protein HII13_004214 [Brettanomyces bruxellensis]|nr:hypothetical protein HII13_004214 [Brettanomyces bruxellensis]